LRKSASEEIYQIINTRDYSLCVKMLMALPCVLVSHVRKVSTVVFWLYFSEQVTLNRLKMSA